MFFLVNYPILFYFQIIQINAQNYKATRHLRVRYGISQKV